MLIAVAGADLTIEAMERRDADWKSKMEQRMASQHHGEGRRLVGASAPDGVHIPMQRTCEDLAATLKSSKEELRFFCERSRKFAKSSARVVPSRV